MGRQAATEATTYAERGDLDPSDVPGSPPVSPPTDRENVVDRPAPKPIADHPFLPGYYLG